MHHKRISTRNILTLVHELRSGFDVSDGVTVDASQNCTPQSASTPGGLNERPVNPKTHTVNSTYLCWLSARSLHMDVRVKAEFGPRRSYLIADYLDRDYSNPGTADTFYPTPSPSGLSHYRVLCPGLQTRDRCLEYIGHDSGTS